MLVRGQVRTRIIRPEWIRNYASWEEQIRLREVFTPEEIELIYLFIRSHQVKKTRNKGKERIHYTCWFGSLNELIKRFGGGKKEWTNRVNNLIKNQFIIEEKIPKGANNYKNEARKLVVNYSKLADVLGIDCEKEKLKSSENHTTPIIEKLEKSQIKYEKIDKDWVKIGRNSENHTVLNNIFMPPRPHYLFLYQYQCTIKREFLTYLSDYQVNLLSKLYKFSLKEIFIIKFILSLHISGYLIKVKGNKKELWSFFQMSDKTFNKFLKKLTDKKLILDNPDYIVLNTTKFSQLQVLTHKFNNQSSSSIFNDGVKVLEWFETTNDSSLDVYSSGFYAATKKAQLTQSPQTFECLNPVEGEHRKANVKFGEYVNFIFEGDDNDINEQMNVCLDLAKKGVVNRIVYSGSKSVHARITVKTRKPMTIPEYSDYWNYLAQLFPYQCDENFKNPVQYTRTPDQFREPDKYRVIKKQNLLFLSNACVEVDMKRELPNSTKIDWSKHEIYQKWLSGKAEKNRHTEIPTFISGAIHNKLSWNEIEIVLNQYKHQNRYEHLVNWAKTVYIDFTRHTNY